MRLNWEVVIKDAWTKIQDAVCPCVVGLSWCDQLVEPREGSTIFEQYDVQPRLASGCIINVRDEWFFLTAGHVLESIKRAPEVGRKTFRFSLLEGIHRPGGRAEHIPLPFDPENVFILDHEGSGLDYGLVPIAPLLRATLSANGVCCVSEDLVAEVDEEFDGYAVIGFPGEEFKVTTKDSPTRRDAAVFIGAATLPVERLHGEDVPETYRGLTGNPFIGKIVSLRGHYVGKSGSVELDSIGGMSGAPIFGLRVKDQSIELGLVAVQSTWIKGQRILGASQVAYLTAGINRYVDERKASG